MIALFVCSPAIAAHAEDLVMPFACRANGGEVQVSPANQTTYRIAGRRDEQPFAHCAAGGADCETMMVHRFAIECDGAIVPWARIAIAAKAAGVAMPLGLPTGYAPVSTLSGRFVLPALTRTQSTMPRVAKQDLSPESVIEPADETRTEINVSNAGNTWVTEVRADGWRAVPGGNPLRVAAAVASVIALLFAASMVAAGRWRAPSWLAASSALSWQALTGTLQHLSAAVANRLKGVVHARRSSKSNYRPDDDLANAMSFLNTRLIEAEVSVAALGPEMLLRDVLNGEVASVRVRIAALERQLPRNAPAKSASIIRALLRDLERISRISLSAVQCPGVNEGLDIDMPQSPSEAYRVLGINADAAPAVAKKLVDALRMSWHPDHARDEADRLRRESRMKQINAAWDLIKDRRAAA